MTLQTKTLDAVIGDRVAKVRMARALRVADIAQRLNLSEEDYLAREAGHARFRSRELATLAELFSVAVSCFFEDTEHKSEWTEPLKGFSLADWIEASRNREGLRQLLQPDRVSASDPQTGKAA